MSHVTAAEKLLRQGRFAEALNRLDTTPVAAEDRLVADGLRVELLERIGRYGQSTALAEQLLRTPRSRPAQRAAAEMALGYCAFEQGFVDAATNHFQRALGVAESAGDLRAVCSCQLRLMNLIADRSGYQAIGPLLAHVRRNVTLLGDSITSAALHISIGELEAKRGLATSAIRHAHIGKNLLAKDENIYWEGIAENVLMATAIMQCDPYTGIEHGNLAVRLADEGGCSSLRRAALGNLGNLYVITGQFVIARQYLELAQRVCPTTGSLSNGALESAAVLALAEERLDDAIRLLAEMKAAVRTPSDWMIYANRHTRLTLVEVIARGGRVDEALAEVEHVLELAERSGDRQLQMHGSLAKAELLVGAGRPNHAIPILSSIVTTLPDHSPDTYARYQRALSIAGLGLNRLELARRSWLRSRRTYQGLHNVCGELELTRAWDRATKNVQVRAQGGSAENLFQNVAALLLHAGRPELVATGLVAILEDAGAIVSAVAVSRGSDGSLETLAAFGAPGEADAGLSERVFAIGTARGRTVEVRIQLRADIESIAAMNAVTLLLGTIRDLERAHAEREERLTLWPLEERRRTTSTVGARALGQADGVRPQGGGDQRQRPHHRRKRHRQGDPGPRHPSLLRPRRQAVHPLQLHRRAARHAREPAVRPSPRRVHRRRPRPRGHDSRRQGRHPVPRRDRRARPRPAAEAAALPRVGRDLPARRIDALPRRRPHRRRDQREPRAAGAARAGSARTCSTA